MILDDSTLVTPFDNPCRFDPAWRAVLAGYLYDNGLRSKDDFFSLSKNGTFKIPDPDAPEPKGAKGKAKRGKAKARRLSPFYKEKMYRPLALDPWVMEHVFMQNDVSENCPLTKSRLAMKLAEEMYEEMDSEAAVKKRLEPLLLTEAGMEIITLDMYGTSDFLPVVEAYERMYFNCRTDEWKLNPSLQLIQSFATPFGPLKMYLDKGEKVDEETGLVVGDGRPIAHQSDVWKAMAASDGYSALIYFWGWDNRAHGLSRKGVEDMMDDSFKASVRRTYLNFYTGMMKHEDAARTLATYTAYQKVASERKKEAGMSGGENSLLQMITGMIRVTAPHMVENPKDQASLLHANEMIQSHLQSQMAISKTPIEDKGEAVNAEVIDAQIKEAMDGR